MKPDALSGIGPIAAYMRADHDRLDQLRRNGAWRELHGAVLRHIGLEERILLPGVRRWRGGAPLPEAARLRDDHTAIAILLIQPPSAETRRCLARILESHRALEEGTGGLYDVCDALAGHDAWAVAQRLRSAPDLILKPCPDRARVDHQVERVLAWLAAQADRLQTTDASQSDRQAAVPTDSRRERAVATARISAPNSASAAS